MLEGSAATAGVSLARVTANGLSHRLALAGLEAVRRSNSDNGRAPAARPLVMLLHGWPESWYSWRHQLSFLSRNGYAACAPDMRGYGGTDAPTNLEGYNVRALGQDVVEIAALLGYRKFAVVGHDFGAYLAWRMALLHPDRVLAVCGMSVPFVGESRDCGPLEALQRKCGRSLETARNAVPRNERLQARFHYMLHHCLPEAAKGYEKNVEEALFRLYAYHPGVECVEGTPEVCDKRMFVPLHGTDDNFMLDATSSPAWWLRMPKPVKLPPWLTRTDLDHYVAEYKRSGFAGGLNWYRALDMNWEETRHLPQVLHQPCLFVSGREDGVIRAHGGAEFVAKRMRELCPNDKSKIELIEGAGHWIQQERPDEVNAFLLDFLQGSAPRDGAKNLSRL